MRMHRAGLIAALSLAGTVASVEKRPPPEPKPDPEPEPERRFIGMDLGAEPGRAVTITANDATRLQAAAERRNRRNAKRLAQSQRETKAGEE